VGIGQRRTDGRWLETLGIVVKVDWKLGECSLARVRRRAIATYIEVEVDRVRHRVRIDVQESRGERAGKLQAGIAGGTVKSSSAAVLGSVSAIVRDGGSAAVLISGHVARQVDRRLEVGGFQGRTRAPVFSNRLDHCLLDPDNALPVGAGALVDGNVITGIVPADQIQPNTVGYFHRAATGDRVPVVIRHVEMTAPFVYPSGLKLMKGLVATDGVTVSGDSGALLYNNSFRAIGTLIGVFGGESYFIPCERAFNALGLAF
jgi:hypothetical protein